MQEGAFRAAETLFCHREGENGRGTRRRGMRDVVRGGTEPKTGRGNREGTGRGNQEKTGENRRGTVPARLDKCARTRYNKIVLL